MFRVNAFLFAASLTVSPLGFDAIAQAGKPDFSGTWRLNVEASDETESKLLEGVGDDTTHGIAHIERARLVERLTQLARALVEIEIEQTERDLRFFDDADNLRIYYLDGGKHVRQTPWGAKLDTVANWDGQQITVRTSGKEIGNVQETFGLEGRQLVYIVRIQNQNFQNEIVVRSYYDRSP